MKQTPKEKATQLINLYIPFADYWDYYEDKSRDENLVLSDAKSIATMNVNEVLMALYENKCLDASFYWEEVKQEIARF